jgi:hypothetical protein
LSGARLHTAQNISQNGKSKFLEAIVVDHKYSGFMRRVSSEAEAIELAQLLPKEAPMMTKSDPLQVT